MAGESSPIYPTQLFNYEVCPQKFLWYSGWERIDLGQGAGRPKPRPLTSRHHAFMGIVIQGVLEDFYTHQMWKQPEGLEDRLEKMVSLRMSREIAKPKMFIDQKMAPSWEEMAQVCRDGVLGYLPTMRHHKLLGEYAKSEEHIIAQMKGTSIAGKVDFLIQRDKEVTILDGKNSLTKMKYVDPDQLRFYALVFSVRYRRFPHKLGFVWFRYPYDAESGEDGITWVDWTQRDLKDLAERAQVAKSGMRRQEFGARAKAKHCSKCDFEDVCPERQELLQINRAKRAASRKKKEKPELELPSGDFSFEDTPGRT